MNRISRLLPALFVAGLPAAAQGPTGASASSNRHEGSQLVRNVLDDQKTIWTSPLHMKAKDMRWLVPLATIGAGLLVTDPRTSKALPFTQDELAVSRWVSRGGSFYTMAGTAGGFYIAGQLLHNDRARETGLLEGEALVDSLLVVQTLKFAAGRERPLNRWRDGGFLKGGHSFPSGHAISTWALASVLSHQYRHRHWVPFAAYAAATLVSASRVSGGNHFASDVVAGSTMGWLIGHYVVNKQSARGDGKQRWKPSIQPLFGPNGNKGVSLLWGQ